MRSGRGKNTKANWPFDSETDNDVATIEAGDPRSTFFRYRTTKDLAADVDKSSMKEFVPEDLEAIVSKPQDEQKKVFAMIVENDDKEFVRGYMFDDETGKQLNHALRSLSETCNNMHAAMKWELCGGWVSTESSIEASLWHSVRPFAMHYPFRRL